MFTASQLVKKYSRPRATKTATDLLRDSVNAPIQINVRYKIVSVSGDKQLVTGQVYAPNSIDAHGHFMTAPELQKVAHGFMADGLLSSIDMQHDNELVDAAIVESFIAREGDPDFEVGSGVATTKINDSSVWELIKNGDLNGYSFEILTYRDEVVVPIEYNSWYYGFTDPDPRDKHDHPFLVHMGDNGEIIWGKTGIGSDGSPAHKITMSNITDAVGGDTHRIHFK